MATLMSDRRFGMQFGSAAALVALIAWWRGWWSWLLFGSLTVAVMTWAVAAVVPAALGPLKRAWMGFGHVLGRIVAPIVLGLMFVLLIVPVAIWNRFRGRDELRLRVQSSESYWIARSDPVIKSESFSRQF